MVYEVEIEQQIGVAHLTLGTRVIMPYSWY